MLKYAKIINEETKQCEVGIGTNVEFYKTIGMTQMDVEQAYDNQWYVSGYAPEEPAPTEEEQRKNRELAYTQDVDPITCHIQRLADEEQTPEIIEEINKLLQKRNKLVVDIQERYPYPVGE